MSQIIELKHSEQRRFISTLEDCLNIRDHADFKRYVTGSLTNIIPHEYFASATGFITNPSKHSIFNVNFNPQYLSTIVSRDGSVKSPIFNTWKDTLRPVCFDRDFYAKNNTAWYDVFVDFGISNVCAHGLLSLDDKEGVFFGFGNLDRAHDQLQHHYIEMFAPHLYFAIRRVQGNEKQHLSRAISLSTRQKEILCWVASGKSSWEIGMVLGISERTVINHITRAMEKLQVHSRTHAVAKAIDLGLIDV